MTRGKIVGTVIAATLAVVATSAVVAWAVTTYWAPDSEADESSSSTGPPTAADALSRGTGEPTILSAAAIVSVAAENGPLYWAGPMEDVRYEVTVTADGSAFIRYIPLDADAGAEDQYLTVATYRFVDGYGELQVVGAEPGSTMTETQNGAIIVTNTASPNSAFFSFPGAAFQVEVFSPVAGEALELTETGAIRLVGS